MRLGPAFRRVGVVPGRIVDDDVWMERRIQYAKTADGVSIAFRTVGEGMPLVYLTGGPWSHIERWAADRDDIVIFTVEEAFELGEQVFTELNSYA